MVYMYKDSDKLLVDKISDVISQLNDFMFRIERQPTLTLEESKEYIDDIFTAKEEILSVVKSTGEEVSVELNVASLLIDVIKNKIYNQLSL